MSFLRWMHDCCARSYLPHFSGTRCRNGKSCSHQRLDADRFLPRCMDVLVHLQNGNIQLHSAADPGFVIPQCSRHWLLLHEYRAKRPEKVLGHSPINADTCVNFVLCLLGYVNTCAQQGQLLDSLQRTPSTADVIREEPQYWRCHGAFSHLFISLHDPIFHDVCISCSSTSSPSPWLLFPHSAGFCPLSRCCLSRLRHPQAIDPPLSINVRTRLQ